ncbi:MAG: hypothetical protein B5M48_03455 [Candidatus Omnitrophica bacterium 4484_213]|nr:MAG: hypothetical protein B5M48_03455 [Candidatus Omnitrophica bacterium 4484_213]
MINILVIDRERAVRQVLKEGLSKIGYSVQAVSSTAEALKLLEEKSFSIILTDLRIPGVKGIEILKKFKHQGSGVSIIAIVPYFSVKLAIEALSKKQIFDYVTKPFNIKEVEIVLRRVVDRDYLLRQIGQKDLYQEMAIIDGLTGLYNRRHLDEMLTREIERARRYRQPLALLMMDIDDFKKYNDTHGHLAGDKLLKDLAKLLLNAVRAADMIFRYGGEEFVVVLPHTFKQEAVEVAKRILNLDKRKLPATISIGLAYFLDEVLSKDELIAQADSALYQAKRLGKKQICLYTEETS